MDRTCRRGLKRGGGQNRGKLSHQFLISHVYSRSPFGLHSAQQLKDPDRILTYASDSHILMHSCVACRLINRIK